MEIKLIHAPNDEDWMEVKRRALVTVGKASVKAPDSWWKYKILRARHSPIRYLMYSFYIHDIPSWVSVHLVRHHVGCQPYVKTQRNDRQSNFDRAAARQDTPVDMIWDLNAEALQVVANKRLCMQASKETREVVAEICRLAVEATPELETLLVPNCERNGMICFEMNPCGRCK